jgi:serine/threonine protein kinase
MAFRRLLRGEIAEETLEGIAREAASRYDQRLESIRLLEADNWLSTPAVLNEEFFLKIITPQNTFVHGLLTTGRNVGVFASGTEGFFERFGTPIGMAQHELDAARQMRELGVNVPEPLEAFEHEGYGVVVFEYLDGYETLETLSPDRVESVAPDLFRSLARMHDAEFVHGDLRGENVLIVDDELFFIDATNVREDAIDDARAYDIACALAELEPHIGAATAVRIAAQYYDNDTLIDAERYLDFVSIRPDHDFAALALKGEIVKQTD